MGDVGSARYEPALVPPCPTIRLLSYSNCRDPPTPLQKFSTVRVKADGLGMWPRNSLEWRYETFIYLVAILDSSKLEGNSGLK